MKPFALLAALLLALGLTACGSDDGGNVTASASASAAPSTDCNVVDGTKAERDSEIHVTLDEWSIEADATSVRAGNVELHTTNDGSEAHELVVIEGATPDQLTIGATGLDEKALPEGAEVLGEIEPFNGKGGVCTGTFALAKGDYTLLCNIVETSGMKHAHAEEGMVTALTVR